MIGLLIQLLILCLILGLVIYVFRTIPVLAPFEWIARLVCVVIVVIWLIDFLLGISGGALVPFGRIR